MTFKRKLRVATPFATPGRVACGQSAAFRGERSPQKAQRNAEEETQNEKRGVSLRREFFQYATILPLRASTRRWLFGRD
jgi:hypothetical protein